MFCGTLNELLLTWTANVNTMKVNDFWVNNCLNVSLFRRTWKICTQIEVACMDFFYDAFFLVILELDTPIHFHWMKESSLNILQRFPFCVSWKRVSHTGLLQHEGEWMMPGFLFLGGLLHNCHCGKSIFCFKTGIILSVKKRHGKCFMQAFFKFSWYQTRNVALCDK